MKDKSLLIAACVAVVAIVGLVIFSQQSAVGNAIVLPPGTPSYSSGAPVDSGGFYESGWAQGEAISERCLRQPREQNACCSYLCTDGAVSEDMFRGCRYACEKIVADSLTQHVNEL